MSANFLTRLVIAAIFAVSLPAPSLLAQPPAAAYTPEAKLTAGFGIAVPVRVNGAAPWWCVLDTGSNHVFSMHSDVAAKLGLTPNGSGQSAGVGPGVASDKRLTGATLSVGGLEIPNRTVVIRDSAQGPTDCIPGTRILAEYVVEMDYRTPALRLYAPQTYKPSGGAVSIPMTLDAEGNPLVQARLLLRPGETVDANLMLDTGPSVWPVALWKRFTDDNRILSRVRKTVEPPFQAGGPGGVAGLLAARADAVSVGPFSSPYPMMMLFRNVSGSAAANSWDGILGPEFIRRFTLTIDYPNRLLFLQRNNNFDAPPQPFDASGILVRGQPGNFAIRKVLANSAGASAGLKEGDIVLSLDGIPSSSLSTDGIQQKLYRTAGRCNFVIRRGDRQLEVMLELAPVQWQ